MRDSLAGTGGGGGVYLQLGDVTALIVSNATLSLQNVTADNNTVGEYYSRIMACMTRLGVELALRSFKLFRVAVVPCSLVVRHWQHRHLQRALHSCTALEQRLAMGVVSCYQYRRTSTATAPQTSVLLA